MSPAWWRTLRLASESGVVALTLRSSLTARAFYTGLGFVALYEARHGDEVTIVMERRVPPPPVA